MPNVEIALTLKNGELTPQGRRFAPNEIIEGTIQVMPDNNLNCRHLYVRLGWHTEGRGDKDSAVIAEMDLYQGTLDAGLPTYHDFNLKLPLGPWSYAGHYVNIIWQIMVNIDVPRAMDPNVTERFILAPPGR